MFMRVVASGLHFAHNGVLFLSRKFSFPYAVDFRIAFCTHRDLTRIRLIFALWRNMHFSTLIKTKVFVKAAIKESANAELIIPPFFPHDNPK